VTCGNPFATRWKAPANWVPALIFGLGILLLLPSVWSETSVTGQDEYWLSFRTPMEMEARGDWLTPWLNGEPRLRKPPLLYWAILLNYKLFGIHLLSARIWGVLSGAGLAVCACLFSRELFRRDGLLAGLLALATMGVAVEGRRAMLDLPAALFSTLAVLCFVKWLNAADSKSGGRFAEPDRGSATRSAVRVAGPLSILLLSGFCLGLSFLTKGPVGFLFFGAGVLACAVVLRAGRVLAANWWQLLLGLAVLAAVCLPWPLAMQHLWSERFGRILGEELAAREFGHWTPGSPLSAWSGALGLALPWTPLMLAGIYSHVRQRSSPHLQQNRFLIAWFLLAALPFFFMKSFERYMLALLPAQIVLGAEWLEENQTGARNFVVRSCVLLLVGVSLFISLFAWWFKLASWEIATALLLTGLALVLAWRSTHPHWLAFVSALVFTCTLGGIYPRFGINALPKALPAEMAAFPVKLFDPPQPSLLSMRLGRSVQIFDAEAPNTNASPPAAEFVIMQASHRPEFLEQLKSRSLRAEEKGSFRTFYSRKAWIRFARPDARWTDWKAAFDQRSLESLKSEFCYYTLSRSTAKPTAASKSNSE